MNKKLLSLIFLGFLSTNIHYLHADDNEIRIDQSGDTLTLLIDQVGFGNTISQTNGGSDKMVITGTTLSFNIDQIGNSNKIFGPVIADTSTYLYSTTGSSNIMDWNIGANGSSDDSNINIVVTGDSNTWNLDQGYQFSAERLDLDAVVIGNSNVFDLDFESNDNTWNWSVTGGSNNINTLQKDGSQTMTVEWVGDSGDVDINQISGTCAAAGGGCSTPNATIVLDVNSDNATVQINQKDSAGDS
jgi:hypothetical protein|tara:strand:- start:622 stop:1353 length:732 start_codon:yes stop_codon:yes gene_type:complete